MNRLTIWLLSLWLAFAPATAQVGIPFPGPGGVAATPIAVPTSLGCAVGTAGASSVVLTTTAAIPSGALVVVGVNVGFAATQTITGVSDATNAYASAIADPWDAGTGTVQQIWQKTNAAAVGSSASLTATFSAASVGGTNVPVICAAYTTGVISASALDKTSAGAKQVPGTAFASGSTGTLTQPNEIAFGWVGSFQNCTTVTEGSSFTTISPSPKLQGSGNNWCGNLAYDKVAATTGLNYQPTLSSSNGASVIATFKGF